MPLYTHHSTHLWYNQGVAGLVTSTWYNHSVITSSGVEELNNFPATQLPSSTKEPEPVCQAMEPNSHHLGFMT